MEDINKDIRKNALSNGAIMGVIFLVLGILLLYLMASWASMWALAVSGLVSFAVYIIVAILFTIDLRKKIGGFWTFRQAVSGIFIMFFIAYALSNIGSYLFTEFVEKDLSAKMVENIKQSTASVMTNQGVDQAQVDQKLSEMDADFENKLHPTLADYGKSLLVAVIVMFVFALIFGAIFKKEPPIIDELVIEE